MATSLKTVKVTLKDGIEGRAVKVTPRNYLAVMFWSGAEDASNVEKKSYKLRVPLNGSKMIRIAVPGDQVVKTSKGFQVIKAHV